VKLGLPPLQEAVLQGYFQSRRKTELLSLKALMASAIPTPEAGKMADQFLRDVQHTLFPEIAPATAEFGEDAKEKMEALRSKVIQISGNTATIEDTEKIGVTELMKTVEETRQAGMTRRNRRRPMEQRQ